MFSDWTFDDYLAQYEKDKSVRWIEPMSSHEIDIFDYKGSVDEFAELKYDGHRGLIHFGDVARCFSRTVSKKSGWFTENTDNVPHIRDMAIPSLKGTVLDGEFDYGNTSMGVQSVMGALPERAIKFQEDNGYIPFKAFDILYYKGINVQRMSLWKRKVYLALVLKELWDTHGEEATWYMIYADMYMKENTRHKFYDLVTHYTNSEIEDNTDDLSVQYIIHSAIHVVDEYSELYMKFLDEDKEGIMLKNMLGIYEQKRSRSYLKIKGQSTWDCVVIGYSEPTKEYTGKELHKWKYWEVDGNLVEISGENTEMDMELLQGIDVLPVTKPYFMGWCGAIEFGVWKDGKLVRVGDCKGLTESEQENIRINGESLIGQVIEVKANGILDEKKGSLRHPRFVKWRKDKTSDMCTWEAHIRKLGGE